MASRRTRRTPEAEAQSGAPAWSLTYGNLVTLLLGFFVVLYAFYGPGGGDAAAPQAKEGQAVKKLPIASLSSVKRRVTANLDSAHAADQVTFETNGEGALVIHLSAGALYDSGSTEIRSTAALDAVGSVLGQIGNAARIEGHTDDVPMKPTPELPDNWALSEARAHGVLRYLLDYHRIASERLSVAGYADTHPVAPNTTPAGRARNRRVDIVVLPR
jgi:chemotaxis protein MotB